MFFPRDGHLLIRGKSKLLVIWMWQWKCIQLNKEQKLHICDLFHSFKICLIRSSVNSNTANKMRLKLSWCKLYLYLLSALLSYGMLTLEAWELSIHFDNGYFYTRSSIILHVFFEVVKYGIFINHFPAFIIMLVECLEMQNHNYCQMSTSYLHSSLHLFPLLIGEVIN